jgi:hypothetical protein
MGQRSQSFHDQGAHVTRDISSDVPVNYDTKRYGLASYSIRKGIVCSNGSKWTLLYDLLE